MTRPKTTPRAAPMPTQTGILCSATPSSSSHADANSRSYAQVILHFLRRWTTSQRPRPSLAPQSPARSVPPPLQSAAPAPSTHRTDRGTATAARPTKPHPACGELRPLIHPRPPPRPPETAESLCCACPSRDWDRQKSADGSTAVPPVPGSGPACSVYGRQTSARPAHIGLRCSYPRSRYIPPPSGTLPKSPTSHVLAVPAS